MKGHKQAWNYLMATWFCWAAIFGSNRVLSLLDVQDPSSSFMGYDMAHFTTVHADRQSYTTFLQSLRNKLASGDERHGVPILPDPSTLSDSNRFLLVQLSNWANVSVALALDVSNAGVVGYGANDGFFFFNNTVPGFSSNFGYSQQNTLAFGSSYSAIEAAAGLRRANLDLGIMALEQAVSTLHGANTSEQNFLAQSLLVVVQMVTDAVRFKHIEQQIRWSIRSNRRIHPDITTHRLQNKWSALSTSIQQSNQGVFAKPVQLQRSHRSTFNVYSVNPQLLSNLALMEFVCKDIESLGPKPNDDGVCATPEPTLQIVGLNNLCIDVKLSDYNIGNTVQMYPCKSNGAVNQLWTLKRDGTIRSNGKCLTTTDFTPGSNVTMHDCASALPDATQWQICENGTIINPKSGLALTAMSPKTGFSLTVEMEFSMPNQAWQGTNVSQPFVTKIVGFMDLCLQAIGDLVWLIECISDEASQKWAIYADGTIRPQQKQTTCLDIYDDYRGITRIIISSCSASAAQRWVFKNDGTIMNLFSGMVMDVKESDPSLEQIILGHPTGDPNQKWLLSLL